MSAATLYLLAVFALDEGSLPHLDSPGRCGLDGRKGAIYC